ncbi:MAG: hypothetical protein IT430_15500 [Phycisphaerales bacterium]|nr:hypothetical protein [Phycisphaerales bacterium]
MTTLLIAVAAGLGFIIAYHTYGRWLGRRIFALSTKAVCPSHRLRDDSDYVPTKKAVIFGHHFTSIAGTGPIVGPAIAVMWGWLPALIWVVLGSVFIGAVHDLGALVVSLRHNGQTIGDVAGRVLNRRVRVLFLLILFMGLTIVLAIFGLVIATVFRQYPASIFPCTVQIPIAVAIGVWLHRKGASLLLPSIIALVIMYLTVVIGDENFSTDLPVLAHVMHGLHAANAWMASWSNMTWVIVLLIYSYVASVLPVWLLLQPRDYINSLQLLSAMGLIVLGLVVAAFIGGAPPVEGAARQPLEVVAPMWNPNPIGALPIFPFLFITIACGAVSGFHCLVSSGTSSKQIESEPDARFVGYGSMLTEGFLATLVIIACVAGLGLGSTLRTSSGPNYYQAFVSTIRDFVDPTGVQKTLEIAVPGDSRAGSTPLGLRLARLGLQGGINWGWHTQAPKEDMGPETGLYRPLGPDSPPTAIVFGTDGVVVRGDVELESEIQAAVVGRAAFNTRYQSWSAAGGLARTVAAFVDGSANLLRAIGLPLGVAVALMGVLVASFAGTTLDTACRLQRYVVQELAATFLPSRPASDCPKCGYTLWQHATSLQSQSDAAFAPEGRENVATGGVNPEGMSGTRGQDAQKLPSPEGSTETPGAREGHTTPSPLRGDDDRAHTSHGFRDAQSSIAPPVATLAGPAGAEDAALLRSAQAERNKPPTSDIQCPECGEMITPEQIEHAGRSMPGSAFNILNPIHWLTNKHGATIFAIVIATVLAALPTTQITPGFWSTLFTDGPGGAWTWMTTNGGIGGLLLWPLFGATNQLLAGLSFIVITMYLWRRRKPLWFLIVPMVFMLIMPMWAMTWQVFIGSADSPRWLTPEIGATKWPLALIGIASIIIEIWMIVEALLVWPRVRGIVERGATDAPCATGAPVTA